MNTEPTAPTVKNPIETTTWEEHITDEDYEGRRA